MVTSQGIYLHIATKQARRVTKELPKKVYLFWHLSSEIALEVADQKSGVTLMVDADNLSRNPEGETSAVWLFRQVFSPPPRDCQAPRLSS